MRWVFLFAVVGAACAPAAGTEHDVPEPPVAPSVMSSIPIMAKPVDIGPGEMSGVTLLGSHSLSMPHPSFGGISGIEIADGRFYAVTDQGWWLEAAVDDRPSGFVLVDNTFAPMLDSSGDRYSKSGGDAEGLALGPGDPAVSFERDHRVMRRADTGRMGGTISPRAFEALPSNSGLEALARLPDGRLLAIAEWAEDSVHPMFLIGPDGVTAGKLPEVPPHDVTGADLGPDGRLYVVLRHYNPLVGVSMRLHRYALTAEGWPDPATRKVLASFAGRTGIDNMEGVALWRDGQGRLRLAVISDDNFNLIQRTLLMDFVVLE